LDALIELTLNLSLVLKKGYTKWKAEGELKQTDTLTVTYSQSQLLYMALLFSYTYMI